MKPIGSVLYRTLSYKVLKHRILGMHWGCCLYLSLDNGPPTLLGQDTLKSDQSPRAKTESQDHSPGPLRPVI